VITPRVLAASFLLAVAPLLASCGGNDESSSPSTTEAAGTESTTTSGDATATTAAPTGGGDSEFCAVSERLDAIFAGEELQSGTQFTGEQVAIFEEAKAAAPDEISDAVTTVLDTYQERGYDESLFEDPEFTGAAQEVAVYVGANCEEAVDDAGDGPDTPVSNEAG